MVTAQSTPVVQTGSAATPQIAAKVPVQLPPSATPMASETMPSAFAPPSQPNAQPDAQTLLFLISLLSLEPQFISALQQTIAQAIQSAPLQSALTEEHPIAPMATAQSAPVIQSVAEPQITARVTIQPLAGAPQDSQATPSAFAIPSQPNVKQEVQSLISLLSFDPQLLSVLRQTAATAVQSASIIQSMPAAEPQTAQPVQTEQRIAPTVQPVSTAEPQRQTTGTAQTAPVVQTVPTTEQTIAPTATAQSAPVIQSTPTAEPQPPTNAINRPNTGDKPQALSRSAAQPTFSNTSQASIQLNVQSLLSLISLLFREPRVISALLQTIASTVPTPEQPIAPTMASQSEPTAQTTNALQPLPTVEPLTTATPTAQPEQTEPRITATYQTIAPTIQPTQIAQTAPIVQSSNSFDLQTAATPMAQST
ncbi:MAG: hypothetical protein IJS15_09605, partial [Victivallales bacterium]|nr:hypothetical protein [Victivallales bacterium]